MAIDLMRGRDGLVVALSGGVDSAVLLALAVEALGVGRVRAATGRSASLARIDLEQAREVARQLGVRHAVVDTEELALSGYRANRGDRCFYCRGELFKLLRQLADKEDCDDVAYGAIVDDLGDVRPGMRAAEEAGVLAPMLTAGITKEDVRQLAAARRLAVADRPASACLASRIPVGTEVTVDRLARVEQAEAGLRGLGFGQLRVRDHGRVARVELDPAEIGRAADPDLRQRLEAAVREAGFAVVSIDPDGYRSPAERRQ